MFNIGGGELLVIMLIALIVLGPQRLPDAARQIGKTMGDLRRLSSGFQNEMKSALDTADDPDRIAPRRNVLAKEDPAAVGEATRADAAPPATDQLPAAPAGPKRRTLTADPVPNGTPVAKASVPKSTVKKAPAKKAAKKPTSATKKRATPAVSKATPRRTKG